MNIYFLITRLKLSWNLNQFKLRFSKFSFKKYQLENYSVKITKNYKILVLLSLNRVYFCVRESTRRCYWVEIQSCSFFIKLQKNLENQTYISLLLELISNWIDMCLGIQKPEAMAISAFSLTWNNNDFYMFHLSVL